MNLMTATRNADNEKETNVDTKDMNVVPTKSSASKKVPAKSSAGTSVSCVSQWCQ